MLRSLVLREPEATFVCDPAAEEIRPGPETPIRGLFLAGDWTNTGPARHDRGRRPQRPPGREPSRRTLTEGLAPRVPGPPAFPRARGLALAWLLVWAPAYAWGYGWANFLQLCDLAVILACVGLWRGSPLLLGMSAVSSLVIDVALGSRPGLPGAHRRPSLRWHRVHVGSPVFAPLRLLSLFHLVWPALLWWALRRVGYDRRALLAQALLALVVLAVSRVVQPDAQHQLRPGRSVHASLVGARPRARGADRARARGPRLRAHARPAAA